MAKSKSEQTNYSLDNIISPSSWGKNGLFTLDSIKAEFETFDLRDFCKQIVEPTNSLVIDLAVVGIGAAVGAGVGAIVGAIIGAGIGASGGAISGAMIGVMIGCAVLACLSIINLIRQNLTEESNADQYPPYNKL